MASVYPATASLPASANIVSRWLLDEASGNRADIVGTNTLVDTTTVPVGTGYTNAISGASFDNAADFELGTTEYFEIADNATLAPFTSFSMATWLKPESLAATIAVLNKYGGAGSKSYNWYVKTDGFNEINISSDGTAVETFTNATTALTTGTWWHVTFVLQASTRVDIYINGVSDFNDTSSIPAGAFDNATAFQLGRYLTDYFDGLMQDFILWNTNLSASQVTSLYQAYTTTTAPQGAPIFFT